MMLKIQAHPPTFLNITGQKMPKTDKTVLPVGF